MRVFVGFGYNERDNWVKVQVFPILECMGFVVVTGEDMHGELLQPEVKRRIEQSDAVVGFLTIRDAENKGDFNSHLWVQNELLWGNAKEKPIVPIKEENVKVPDAMLGNIQYIPLRQNDRLACISELVRALGRRHIRRIKLEPEEDALRKEINKWRVDQNFSIRYRTQDGVNGLESDYKTGRLEVFDQGFYLNLVDVPQRAYLDVEGVLNGQTKFSSGWASADAVSIKI
jgi:hypothetical protein